MRVLLTGGAGYIGSVLSGMLVDEGFDVTVLDRFFFGKEALDYLDGQIKLVQGDTRWVDSSILKGVDAVIDMAALSNDPVCELYPEATLEINFKARVRMATMAKKNKVKKYILASSCSVYGFKKEIVTEESPVNPLTNYAKANVLWENGTLPLSDRNFCVTALRQSSAYGASPKMRFDISLNNMTRTIFKGNKIPIMRDGNQLRPMIHIKDTSNAFITVLKADEELVNKQIFNSGSNEQNYKIYDIAKLASESIGAPFNFEWYGTPDFRSYRINFDKIRKVLGFKTKHDAKYGAKEIYDGLKNGTIKDDEKTMTLPWYKRLMEMQSTVKGVEMNGVIL